MKKVLLLLFIPFFLSSCIFDNPVDEDNYSQIESGNSSGSESEIPEPGDDGVITINQRPGLMVAGFSQTDNNRSDTTYRGAMSSVPLDSNTRFNAVWNQDPSSRFFTNYEIYDHESHEYPGLYYRTILDYNGNDNSYTARIQHDSNNIKNFNVQAINYDNAAAIYRNTAISQVPLYGNATIFGGSGDERPQTALGEEYGSRECAAVQDNEGNIYVAFHFEQNISLPGGPAITPLGGNDIILAKYDTDFNYLWHRRIQSAGDDQFTNLVITPGNDIYICGLFRVNETASEDPLYIDSTSGTQQLLHQIANTEESFAVCYAADGSIEQLYQFQHPTIDTTTSRNLLKKVLVDNEGNRYLIGVALNRLSSRLPWENAIYIESIQGIDISAGEYNWFGFIIKEDANHNFMGYNYFGFCPTGELDLATPALDVTDAVVSNDGQIYITGRFNNAFYLYPTEDWDVSGSSATYTQYSSVNMYVLALDTNLNIGAHMSARGDMLHDEFFLEISPGGGLYLIGAADPGISFFYSPDSGMDFNWQMVGSARDIFILGLDPSNLWCYGQSIMENELNMTPRDTITDQYGVLYLSGEYSNIHVPQMQNFAFDTISYKPLPVPQSESTANAFVLACLLPDNDMSSISINEPHIRFITGVSSIDSCAGTSLFVTDNSLLLGGTFTGEILPARGFPDGNPDVSLTGQGLTDIYVIRMRIGNL
ncbi:MAG: hypothetical protein JW874_15905 [Spirochaetales bacterium]|nr:hypothetical protein [Spirochaetales bacterium]